MSTTMRTQDSAPSSVTPLVIMDRPITARPESTASYDVEQWDPDWQHSEISDIMVISPKLKHVPHKHMTISNFHILHILGEGTASKILLARHTPSAKLYAVKSINKALVLADGCVAYVRAEREALTMITQSGSPFLPSLHWSFQDDERLFLVMDYCPGGDLLTHITRHGAFPPARARFYASEIIEALSAIHRLGIVHRDLKPENIMLTADGHIVVTDFGYAKILKVTSASRPEFGAVVPFDGGRSVSRCGTREYQAPEMIMGWTHDFAVDCWGFGVLLYLMLFGSHPFMIGRDFDDIALMQHNILYGFIKFPPKVNAAAKDLVTKCLERNPGARPNVGEVKQHPYFSKLDWTRVAAKDNDAPFVPELSDNELDLQYFEKEFAEKTVDSTLKIPAFHGLEGEDHDFAGYTWIWDPAAEREQELDGDMDLELERERFRASQTIRLVKKRPSGLGLDVGMGAGDGPWSASSVPELAEDTGSPISPTSEADAFSEIKDKSGDGFESLPALEREGERLTVYRDISVTSSVDFWDALDASTASASASLSGRCPRKLRKSRSAFMRAAALMQARPVLDKFGGRKNRPLPAIPAAAASLPKGIEQIGEGIGFRYTAPAGFYGEFEDMVGRGCVGWSFGGVFGRSKKGPYGTGAWMSASSVNVRETELEAGAEMGEEFGAAVAKEEMTTPPRPTQGSSWLWMH